jgi:hypothetical protein
MLAHTAEDPLNILYIQERIPYVYSHLNAKIMSTVRIVLILWVLTWFHEYKYMQILI